MSDDFDMFVKEVQPRMHNLGLALAGGNVHEAQDLVQASLERIYRTWGKVRIEQPHAYARTVLTREFISSRRRLRWARERLSSQPPEQQTADFSGNADDAAVLLKALAALPRRQREVVVLRYLEDLSVSEVASLLSCSEGTVKRSAYDGLASLRRATDLLGERT